MDKQGMVCSCSGIQLDNKKEYNIDTLNNMDEPQNNYVAFKMPFKKAYDSV